MGPRPCGDCAFSMAFTVEPAVFGTLINTIRGVICCPAGQVSSCTRPTRHDRTQARAHCGCKSQRGISTAGPCACQDPYSNDIFHALDLGYPEPGREAVDRKSPRLNSSN